MLHSETSDHHAKLFYIQRAVTYMKMDTTQKEKLYSGVLDVLREIGRRTSHELRDGQCELTSRYHDYQDRLEKVKDVLPKTSCICWPEDPGEDEPEEAAEDSGESVSASAEKEPEKFDFSEYDVMIHVAFCPDCHKYAYLEAAGCPGEDEIACPACGMELRYTPIELYKFRLQRHSYCAHCGNPIAPLHILKNKGGVLRCGYCDEIVDDLSGVYKNFVENYQISCDCGRKVSLMEYAESVRYRRKGLCPACGGPITLNDRLRIMADMCVVRCSGCDCGISLREYLDAVENTGEARCPDCGNIMFPCENDLK